MNDGQARSSLSLFLDEKGEESKEAKIYFSHWTVVTWLILPVVICLSQRLSHACLSINKFIL